MKHEHYWNYDQAIYSSGDGGHGAHRWCACGVHQVANVGKWHKPSPKIWDIEMFKRVVVREEPIR
jgi:hypothetical protein